MGVVDRGEAPYILVLDAGWMKLRGDGASCPLDITLAGSNIQCVDGLYETTITGLALSRNALQ
jgi:hypothetical protein